MDLAQILLLPLIISGQVGGITPVLAALMGIFILTLGIRTFSKDETVLTKTSKILFYLCTALLLWTIATIAVVESVRF